MPHPSFGNVPPSVFRAAQELPAGKCHKALREYEPLIGLPLGLEPKTFKFELCREVTTKQSCTIETQGQTEEIARKVLDEMDWDSFNWQETYLGENISDEYVVRTTEIK